MHAVPRQFLCCLTLVTALLTQAPSLQAESPLNFKASEVPVTLPDGWFLGEVAGLEFNSKGHMIVFNRGDHALLELAADGTFIREFGQGLFKTPHGLRVDAEDNIWVTDQETHRVLKITPEGKVAMVLGRGGFPGTGWYDRGYSITLLNAPSDVAFDSDGNIYVADGGNFRIVKFNKHGEYIKAWGNKGSTPGDFNFPHSLVVDSNNILFVTDRENARVQLFNTAGVYLGEWRGLGNPYVIQHGKNNSFWITDARAGKLLHVSGDGILLGSFGQWGKEIGDFGFPHGFAIAPDGAPVIGELSNWRIQKLEPRR